MKNRKTATASGFGRVSQVMSIDDLTGHILNFDAATPITDGLIRRIYSPRAATASSARKHGWQVWFDDYKGPGYKNRKDWNRDARFVYNSLQKVIMLLWLAESAGVSRDLLEKASAEVPREATEGTRAARFRKIVPWRVVEAALAAKKHSGPKRRERPDPPVTTRPTGGGFGSPEENRIVEEAAIAFVCRHLEEDGWEFHSVEREKCGFDLDCLRAGELLHVEVKGISGETCSFIVTEGELQRAKEDKSFRLFAVTAALTERPVLRVISGPDLDKGFELRPLAWMAKPAVPR